MTTARNLPSDTSSGAQDSDAAGLLTPQELLSGSLLVHDVLIPDSVLNPGQTGASDEKRVRLRPLRVATLALISAAARDEPAIVPLLMIKESLVAPVLSFDQIRQMHAGLVQFLAAAINRISGLEQDAAVRNASGSAIGAAHVELARHFGWTPAQVAELTPGQIAVYLAHISPAGRSPTGGG